MNTRTALRKSLLIAPAEDALKRAESISELEDAWFDFADGFSDESIERRQLLAVYQEQVKRIRNRELEAAGLSSIMRV